jgi:hypothetical protein
MVLIVEPAWLLRRGLERGPRSDDARFRPVVRILGARHVVQAVVTAVRPTPMVRWAGAVIDCLHATTDIGCAVLDRRRRRAASIDAGVAVALAVATVTVGAAGARRDGR